MSKLLSWVIGPALPYVAGGVILALSIGAWQINDRAYDRAVAATDKKWRDDQTIAAAAALKRERDLQAQVDAAGGALSAAHAEIDTLADLAADNTRGFYAQNPAANVACLTPDRLRSIQESDAAAAKAATAAR